MIHYKELGLSNTRDMFKKAMTGGYAIPAYNFNNLEQMQAIVTACIETRSPFILQVSKGARKYANQTLLRFLAMGAAALIKEAGVNVPFALHLDHGDTFELCKSCVETGFSSIMIDGSHHSFDDNIKLTKQVVEFCRPLDVTVEGELGVLAGIEDEVSSEHSHYTDPKQVEEFVKRTGVDSLAISIGTSHGAYKFKPRADGTVPPLRFDILQECEKRLPGFPIVLHGASSVMPEYVELINKYGGKMVGAMGVSEEQLRKAAAMSVCKVNIDSDGRLAVTAKVREYLAKNPEKFDPRDYLGAAREELVKLIKHKNQNVLGSAGRA